MDPFDYAHKHSKDIVWMSQNTNQIPITEFLDKAILKAVQEGDYNLYPRPDGIFGLSEAISCHLALPEDYQILLTNGGIEGLYILFRALLPKGGEVICTDPSFMPIHHQIEISGGILKELPIYQPPWKMTVEQIGSAITGNTKMILLIDSINPLGTAYDRSEVKEICELAEEHDLIVIDDVTYRDFSEPVGTYEFVPDRTIVSYTFSKNCGLAGMRIGVLAAPKPLMEKMLPYNTNVLGVNILAQRAALAALEKIEQWLPSLRQQLLKNQALIKDTVDKVEGTFLPVYPSRTNMFVIDISQTGINPDDVEEKMLFEHNVFLRSGNYVSKRFGNKFVRVSFSVPYEGVERFAKAFPKVIEELRK
jgi:aspartate/methionine/tyrosine aminotransferase